MTKLIHPKTGTVRESNSPNKEAILKRAGFILFENYRAPKPKKVVAEPTLADQVEGHAVPEVDESENREPEIAIHVSASARGLIEKNDLDPALIEGTGKDGQINKPDVEAYLESLEEENAQDEQEPEGYIDIEGEDVNSLEAVSDAPGDDLVKE